MYIQDTKEKLNKIYSNSNVSYRNILYIVYILYLYIQELSQNNQINGHISKIHLTIIQDL